MRRVNFVVRDVVRSTLIGGLMGLGGGVILSGYSPFMWLTMGTCGAAAGASRAVHWKHRRFRLIRRLRGLEVDGKKRGLSFRLLFISAVIRCSGSP